jgi:hypothetical protein
MAKQEPATSFESILDTPADKVERPKPLPAGTYSAIVKGMPEHGVSAQKKTPFVRFTYVLQDAFDDVDEDELAALLTDKDGNVSAISEKSIKDTYYTTPDSLFRLTDALEAMGIELDQKTIRAALDETPNCSINIVVSHRTPEGSDQIFAEVKRIMKAE